MGFLHDLFNNTRKPQGILGKMMVNSMNSGHSKMSLWGMQYLPQTPPDAIVELGCGGGRTAARLLKKYPGAQLTALDYADVSVEKTRKVNKAAVQSGRCIVTKGDVSRLELPSDHYDLATAFETVYFWPGPLESFQQVYRVLKSGGTFLIVNESDGTDAAGEKWTEIIDGMHIYPEKEMLYWLSDAGFANVQVYRKPDSHWICFVATKD